MSLADNSLSKGKGKELMKQLLLVGLLLAIPAVAQMDEAATEHSTFIVASLARPDAPSALLGQPALPVLAIAVKTKPLPGSGEHSFFDRSARIRLTLLAGLIAADGITTQQVLGKGGSEVNPIARPFVKHGAAGQLAASSLGYAATVTTSYLFHRTHHHKLERLFQNTAIGVEGGCTVQNLIQNAR